MMPMLHGSECLQVIQTDFHKIEAFHNGSGPEPSQNWKCAPKKNSKPIKTTIKRRRLRWLGNILRMSQNRIPRVALRWIPKGNRKQGRP